MTLRRGTALKVRAGNEFRRVDGHLHLPAQRAAIVKRYVEASTGRCIC